MKRPGAALRRSRYVHEEAGQGYQGLCVVQLIPALVPVIRRRSAADAAAVQRGQVEEPVEAVGAAIQGVLSAGTLTGVMDPWCGVRHTLAAVRYARPLPRFCHPWTDALASFACPGQVQNVRLRVADGLRGLITGYQDQPPATRSGRRLARSSYGRGSSDASISDLAGTVGGQHQRLHRHRVWRGCPVGVPTRQDAVSDDLGVDGVAPVTNKRSRLSGSCSRRACGGSSTSQHRAAMSTAAAQVRPSAHCSSPSACPTRAIGTSIAADLSPRPLQHSVTQSTGSRAAGRLPVNGIAELRFEPSIRPVRAQPYRPTLKATRQRPGVRGASRPRIPSNLSREGQDEPHLPV